jgi:hypothetical protein
VTAPRQQFLASRHTTLFRPKYSTNRVLPLPIAENVGFARFEQLSTAYEQFGKHLQSVYFLV